MGGRGDSADIAILEIGLSSTGFVLGDVVNGKPRNTGLDFAHGRDEGGVVF